MKKYYTYILASKENGTLYIGVTSDLVKRIYQHKEGIFDSFTKRYKVNKLVHYEETSSVEAAISREKQLKVWRRSWKIELIEKENPAWKDLYKEITGMDSESSSE